MGDIAVIGPITGVVAAPVLGLLLAGGSLRLIYLALGVLSLVPLLRVPIFEAETTTRTKRVKGGARAAYALVAALGVLTMGGSAVFVFTGVIAMNKGMSATSFSLVLALNAAAGIPSSRWTGRRPISGVWLVITGIAAVGYVTASSQTLLFVILTVWGFSYWMGIPGAYALLSERSYFPSERAGDAQAVMAIGRIFGPVIGGLLVAESSLALGLFGGGLMMLAGVAIVAIELRSAPRSSQ